MHPAVEAVIDAIHQHIGSYQPSSGKDLDAWLGSHADLLRELGAAFSSAAQHMESEFIHPSVPEALNELGGVQAGIADHATDVYRTHLTGHELWLAED